MEGDFVILTHLLQLTINWPLCYKIFIVELLLSWDYFVCSGVIILVFEQVTGYCDCIPDEMQRVETCTELPVDEGPKAISGDISRSCFALILNMYLSLFSFLFGSGWLFHISEAVHFMLSPFWHMHYSLKLILQLVSCFFFFFFFFLSYELQLSTSSCRSMRWKYLDQMGVPRARPSLHQTCSHSTLDSQNLIILLGSRLLISLLQLQSSTILA